MQADRVRRPDNLHLILASQSPRRIELLQNLGLSFECLPSHIDETTSLSLPCQIVLALSLAKAQEVAASLKQSGTDKNGKLLILGADTIVALGSEILNKPDSKDDAYRMLMKLSGQCHQVYTGVTLLSLPGDGIVSRYEVSSVYFRNLFPVEVLSYIETGEPMDKAGAYALQGIASCFVEKIEGCYTNIIGLPVPLTTAMLREAGISVLGLPEK